MCLLGENAAAVVLGVTKELLYKYVRYAPKQGETIKLRYHVENGKEGFLRRDLDEWSEYLWRPWPYSIDRRQPIPEYIVDHLKVECQGRCGVCDTGNKLVNAHLTDWSVCRSHHHLNLIRICESCHSKVTDGILDNSTLQRAKHKLVERVRSEIRRENSEFTPAIATYTPNPTSIFVGRENDFASLRTHLKTSRIVIIQGVGGIGKTELLTQLLYQDETSSNVLWIHGEQYASLLEMQLGLDSAIERLGLSTKCNSSIFELLRDCDIRLVFDGIERICSKENDELQVFF